MTSSLWGNPSVGVLLSCIIIADFDVDPLSNIFAIIAKSHQEQAGLWQNVSLRCDPKMVKASKIHDV